MRRPGDLLLKPGQALPTYHCHTNESSWALNLGGFNFEVSGCDGHLFCALRGARHARLFIITRLTRTDYTIAPVAYRADGFAPLPLAGDYIDGRIYCNEQALELRIGRQVQWRLRWQFDQNILQLMPPGPEYADDALHKANAALLALRYVMPFVWARNHGLFLHATGAVLDDQGLLLAGRSGRGKSTLARLLDKAGGTILSDERVIVRELNAGPVLYGTPWPSVGSRFALPGPVPLRHFMLLEHGEQNECYPVAPLKVFQRLFSDPSGFFPRQSPALLRPAMTTLESILQRVPCHILKFRPDASAGTFLRQVLHRESV